MLYPIELGVHAALIANAAEAKSSEMGARRKCHRMVRLLFAKFCESSLITARHIIVFAIFSDGEICDRDLRFEILPSSRARRLPLPKALPPSCPQFSCARRISTALNMKSIRG
jgi:hypothetical protein